jgi:23S rRNA pseudouridine955/2504/2580 synthase
LKPSHFNISDHLLFENRDFLGVNKPPYLSTLEDRNDKDNLLKLVREIEPDAQVGHRLDKDTSGVLIVARHAEAYRHISMQLEHREVRKVYHAIADGIHQFEEQLVDRPILKQNDGTVKISREGKSAQTWFNTLTVWRAHTMLECRPVTGRMHQIRIHLATLGAPISGDEMYGGKPVYLSAIKRKFKLKKFSDEEPLMKRMALHAFSIEFLGLGGEKIKVEAPYPKDFRALVKQLTS